MSKESPFPKRLKEARLKAGLSQKEVGLKAGVDPGSASARMNHYEKGKHHPDYAMASRIAEVLKAPTPFFYTDDDDLAAWILKFKRKK